MEVIDGPIAPVGGGIIYQVTLASGAVVTNPSAFEAGTGAQVVSSVMTEGGVSLMPREHESEPTEFDRFSALTRQLVAVPKAEIEDQRRKANDA